MSNAYSSHFFISKVNVPQIEYNLGMLDNLGEELQLYKT